MAHGVNSMPSSTMPQSMMTAVTDSTQQKDDN